MIVGIDKIIGEKEGCFIFSDLPGERQVGFDGENYCFFDRRHSSVYRYVDISNGMVEVSGEKIVPSLQFSIGYSPMTRLWLLHDFLEDKVGNRLHWNPEDNKIEIECNYDFSTKKPYKLLNKIGEMMPTTTTVFRVQELGNNRGLVFTDLPGKVSLGLFNNVYDIYDRKTIKEGFKFIDSDFSSVAQTKDFRTEFNVAYDLKVALWRLTDFRPDGLGNTLYWDSDANNIRLLKGTVSALAQTGILKDGIITDTGVKADGAIFRVQTCIDGLLFTDLPPLFYKKDRYFKYIGDKKAVNDEILFVTADMLPTKKTSNYTDLFRIAYDGRLGLWKFIDFEPDSQGNVPHWNSDISSVDVCKGLVLGPVDIAFLKNGVIYTKPDRIGKSSEAKATSDAVNHPKHYNKHPSGIECIQIVEHMNFNLGNVVKYVWRADDKNAPIEDLKKAAFYLAREITRREGETK